MHAANDANSWLTCSAALETKKKHNQISIVQPVSLRLSPPPLYCVKHLYLSVAFQAGACNVCVLLLSLSISKHAQDLHLHSAHFCTRQLIARRVCLVVVVLGDWGVEGICQPFLFMIKWQKIIGGVKYAPTTLHCPKNSCSSAEGAWCGKPPL